MSTNENGSFPLLQIPSSQSRSKFNRKKSGMAIKNNYETLALLNLKNFVRSLELWKVGGSYYQGSPLLSHLFLDTLHDTLTEMIFYLLKKIF